jgi:hypothetical protein
VNTLMREPQTQNNPPKYIAMKTLLALLTLAAVTPAAHAGTCPSPAPAYCPPKASAKPAYAYTKKLATRTECRWYTDKCGKRASYEVTYVTYADYYTDGSHRTYTKEIRS